LSLTGKVVPLVKHPDDFGARSRNGLAVIWPFGCATIAAVRGNALIIYAAGCIINGYIGHAGHRRDRGRKAREIARRIVARHHPF